MAACWCVDKVVAWWGRGSERWEARLCLLVCDTPSQSRTHMNMMSMNTVGRGGAGAPGGGGSKTGEAACLLQGGRCLLPLNQSSTNTPPPAGEQQRPACTIGVKASGTSPPGQNPAPKGVPYMSRKKTLFAPTDKHTCVCTHSHTPSCRP